MLIVDRIRGHRTLKDVRLLGGDVLVRCRLSNKATSNHVAHDATDGQWVCNVGLCELCGRQRYFTFRKGLEDSKVPADVDERSLSTLLRELRQYILHLKGHKRCCHLPGFNLQRQRVASPCRKVSRDPRPIGVVTTSDRAWWLHRLVHAKRSPGLYRGPLRYF